MHAISSPIVAPTALPGVAPSPDVVLGLCLCSRWDGSALPALRACARAAAIDWDAVLRLALAQDLAPLLYTILHGRGLAPAAVESALRAAYEENAIRNAVILDALDRIAARLVASGIPLILLKGAALVETIYGNAAARPMNDLDLLVGRGDVPAALSLLQAEGFRPVRAEVHPGATLAYENELLLRAPGPVEMLLELHWHLFDSPHHQRALPLAWFWETAVPLPVGGSRALGLGPEALLIYLCAHLILHHRGQGLKWWQDVAEVVRFCGDSLDWSLLCARAKEADLVLPLQSVLLPLVDTWGVRLPDTAGVRLRDLRPSAAERRVFASLTAAHRPVARRFWADLAGQPTWRARGHFAWVNLLPSPGYMRSRYGARGDWPLPLLYLYRWWSGLVGARSGGRTRAAGQAPEQVGPASGTVRGFHA